MIRFAEPAAFLLLLSLPALAYLLFRKGSGHEPRMTFSSTELLRTGRKTLRIRLRSAPKLLSLAALGLLIVAMARPQSAWEESPRRVEGIDIMLVLDVSESMRALDFKPNRLVKSKEVVKEFIKGRKDDQIGVAIFARETFTLCPLTRDYSTLETFVDRIDFDLVDGRATAIGMGLANAVNKLKDSAAKSKVIILLTDGDNNWGEILPESAAQIASQLGVRTYTIGVGSQGSVDIPIRVGTRWVNQPWQSTLDVETLKTIAEVTGGKFFAATDGRKLEEIYEEIDKLERTEYEVNESNYFSELAHWWIGPALFLFAFGFVLEHTWLRSFP